MQAHVLDPQTRRGLDCATVFVGFGPDECRLRQEYDSSGPLMIGFGGIRNADKGARLEAFISNTLSKEAACISRSQGLVLVCSDTIVLTYFLRRSARDKWTLVTLVHSK